LAQIPVSLRAAPAPCLDANAPFEPKSCDRNQDTRTQCAPKRLDNIFRIVEIGATQTDDVGLLTRLAPI
jgi:hypothetical protein